MRVGRGEAAWWVGHLESDYGLAGGVGEGVVVEDLDGFAGPRPGGWVSMSSVPPSVVIEICRRTLTQPFYFQRP